MGCRPRCVHKDGPEPFVTLSQAGSAQISMYGYSSKGKKSADTVTKELVVLDREGGANYRGDFKGKNTGAGNDPFTVRIFRIVQDLPAYPSNTHVLGNLPKGCLSSLPASPLSPLTTLHFGYRMFTGNAARCFPATRCTGTFRNGILAIDYAVRDTTQAFDPVSGLYRLLPLRFEGHKQ